MKRFILFLLIWVVRMVFPYRTIEEMVVEMESPNREAVLRLWNDHARLFEQAPGSKMKHQAWSGGYLDHVSEAMNMATVLYRVFDWLGRPWSFPLTDVWLVLFLHDLEKPWLYVWEGNQFVRNDHLATTGDRKTFREDLLRQYGIVLNQDQLNALTYVEGEGSDYASDIRVMNPLAALCHIADTMSARIWYDQGRERRWQLISRTSYL